jgi:hypothetical protein
MMKNLDNRPTAKVDAASTSGVILRNPFPKSDPIGKLTVTKPWQVELLKKVKTLQKAVGSRA